MQLSVVSLHAVFSCFWSSFLTIIFLHRVLIRVVLIFKRSQEKFKKNLKSDLALVFAKSCSVSLSALLILMAILLLA